jgi:hypothetical protein
LIRSRMVSPAGVQLEREAKVRVIRRPNPKRPRVIFLLLRMLILL